MFGQEGHAREGLAARLARVALDVRVGLQVGAQVGAVGEGAGAVRAGERLLARVRPDVALQEPRPGEGLAAQEALAGQRVRADVHLQGAQRDVDLLAVLAAEGFLVGRLLGRAVQLLVLRQTAVGRVGLVAIRALVAGRRSGRRRRRRRRRGCRRGTASVLLVIPHKGRRAVVVVVVEDRLGAALLAAAGSAGRGGKVFDVAGRL